MLLLLDTLRRQEVETSRRAIGHRRRCRRADTSSTLSLAVDERSSNGRLLHYRALCLLPFFDTLCHDDESGRVYELVGRVRVSE